jgi:hypothetical protein
MTWCTDGCPNEKGFLAGEKTITAKWAPQRTDSSCAFLNRPARLFEKQTCNYKKIIIISLLPISFLKFHLHIVVSYYYRINAIV